MPLPKFDINLISNKKQKKIITLYKDSISIEKIKILLNLSINTIRKVLEFHNITRRSRSEVNTRYEVDHHYFLKIDTGKKAYFLGLLYADGCITKGNVLTISLQENDGYIIEKLINDIYIGEKPKCGYYSKNTFINKKRIANVAQINIVSKYIYNDLIKLGCFPQKTFTLLFPSFNQVPLKFMNHFIRGYFDGDGSVSFHFRDNNKIYPKCEVAISSTDTYCLEYQKFLKEHLNINSHIQKHETSKGISICKFQGIESILKIYNYMYNDIDNNFLFLKRKKKTFEKYLKERKFYEEHYNHMNIKKVLT